MAAQAVSGPVWGLILALFWTPRNRENRAPVEARCYFLQKSPHALGSPKSTPNLTKMEPKPGPKTTPGGLRRGTHAVPQRCSNLALKSKRFWTILGSKRGSQMGPRIGPKSALAPKGRPEAAEAPPGGLQGPFGDQFWITLGPYLGPILELPEADFRATATATAATAVATPTTTATATATARASGPSALEPLVLPRWSGASAPLEPKPQPPLGLSLSSFLIKGLGL